MKFYTLIDLYRPLSHYSIQWKKASLPCSPCLVNSERQTVVHLLATNYWTTLSRNTFPLNGTAITNILQLCTMKLMHAYAFHNKANINFEMYIQVDVVWTNQSTTQIITRIDVWVIKIICKCSIKTLQVSDSIIYSSVLHLWYVPFRHRGIAIMKGHK